MSGGSYDYLYSKNAEDLILSTEKLDSMIDRLCELDISDISQESLMLKSDLNKIQSILAQMQNKIDKLSPVWKAVEWFDSSDIDASELFEIVQKYRKDNS